MEQLRAGLWTWTAPHPEWHEQPVALLVRDPWVTLMLPMHGDPSHVA
jgi:hypothetical protein